MFNSRDKTSTRNKKPSMYKLLIPVCFIFLFILFLFITKMQHRIQKEEDKISISLEEQKNIYNSYLLAVDEIKNEADKRFPTKNTDENQNKKYHEFYQQYINNAYYNIEQYYNVNTKALGQIIIKGENESWTMVREPQKIE